MPPKILIFLALAGWAFAIDCTSDGTCPDSQMLLQVRTNVEELADEVEASIDQQDSSEEEAGEFQSGMFEATGRLKKLIALGHSVGAIRTSMDASQQLSVRFRHQGQEYNYRLTPHSVYTDDAAIYEDGVLVGKGADSEPSTFKGWDNGRWASMTLLGAKMVRGLFEHEGKVMEITPVSHYDEMAPALLETSGYPPGYENHVHPAHLIRWVAASKLGTLANQPGLSLSEMNSGWGGDDPTVDDGSHMPVDKVDDGPESVDDAYAGLWKGEKWWPGCYTGDSEMQEFILTIATDKAAKDKWGSDLKKIAEDIINEASWIYERQMHIRLKIGHLEMDTNGSVFGGCAANGEEMLDKLATIKSAVESGKVPAGGASHLFTGCGEKLGIAGLAYKGTICEKKWAVGNAKIHTTSPWLVFAHELGHNFNGDHSFEDGEGKTGGIMDYGDGTVNGEYQFNKYRKNEMCSKIDSKVNTCEGKFQKDTAPHPTPPASPHGPGTDPFGPGGGWDPTAIVESTPPPIKVPTLPPGSRPDCKGNRDYWSSAGFGMCEGYTKEVGNFPWCEYDKQTEGSGVSDNDGLLASEVCSECGRCKDKTYTVGEPFVCADSEKYPGFPSCYCNGDVYFGKKYVSGNSGATTTFEQMKQDDCKPYKEDKFQKTGCKVKTYEELKSSRRRPGYKWTKCGGCMSFYDRGFLDGYKKYCYCNPLHELSTTPEPVAPPTPSPPDDPFSGGGGDPFSDGGGDGGGGGGFW